MSCETAIFSRWPNSAAFYGERDNRTLLGVSDLQVYVNRPISIVIDPADDRGAITQRIALLAANLTARWARDITIHVGDVPLDSQLDLHGDQTLAARMIREMKEADPFGRFTTSAGSPEPGSLRLFIGPWADRILIGESDYCVYAQGWSALASRSTGTASWLSWATAPAAALAATLGAGDLFKRAVGHPRSQWLGNINWCTWTHQLLQPGAAVIEERAEQDIGRVLIAGVGAVGSALLYILALMNARGVVTLLDRDEVEASNLNRSPLFTASDAALALHKTDVGAKLLRLTEIKPSVIKGTWHKNATELSRQVFDVWVSLTNEEGAWAEVPFQMPPIVLHGTTTSGWGVGFGRHIPRVEDCTLCRLPQPHAAFRGVCAEGEISTPSEMPIRASLPFLSTASAALIAAELLKLTLPASASQPNSITADFLHGLPIVVSNLRGSTASCPGCKIQLIAAWESRGGRGRYAKLSAPRSIDL